jgi:hypothetical protein
MNQDYETEAIPVEYAQPGTTLLYDWGEGPQLFQVESFGMSSRQQDDGSYVTTFKLKSGATTSGGEPWTLELPAGTNVVAVYQKGRRPSSFPARG